MIRVKLISDLHVDSTKWHYTRGEEDLLIILGDIANGQQGIGWVKHNVPKDLPCIVVLGNHDFYYEDYEETIQTWITEFTGTNITILHNDDIMIDGVRFIGGTMFSDFNLDGVSESWFVKQRAKDVISDFSLIKNWGVGRHCDEFEKFEKFLKLCYEDSKNARKTIVLTHFCPSIKSVHDKYSGSYLNPFFTSNMEHLFYGCDIWMHGHTHENFDYVHDSTRVICNPFGYWMENSGFKENLIIEV